ncbi:MAG: Hsp20/alpha crystallin family protein [Candidatus Eisenbacteria bacterium]|nr:Hsp20/alpha crystallin family protein [Candidatus Eisenbacteria bacterium]
MRLMQYDPNLGTTNLFDWMNGFFSGGRPEQRTASETPWAPRTDVMEKENDYEITIDLPGLDKKDIKITVHDGVLEVTGERNLEKSEDSKGYQRIERLFGCFRRSFRLPKEVRAEEIESTYDKGVLGIRIPKAEEALPKQIEVKVK